MGKDVEVQTPVDWLRMKAVAENFNHLQSFVQGLLAGHNIAQAALVDDYQHKRKTMVDRETWCTYKAASGPGEIRDIPHDQPYNPSQQLDFAQNEIYSLKSQIRKLKFHLTRFESTGTKFAAEREASVQLAVVEARRAAKYRAMMEEQEQLLNMLQAELMPHGPAGVSPIRRVTSPVRLASPVTLHVERTALEQLASLQQTPQTKGPHVDDTIHLSADDELDELQSLSHDDLVRLVSSERKTYAESLEELRRDFVVSVLAKAPDAAEITYLKESTTAHNQLLCDVLDSIPRVLDTVDITYEFLQHEDRPQQTMPSLQSKLRITNSSRETEQQKAEALSYRRRQLLGHLGQVISNLRQLRSRVEKDLLKERRSPSPKKRHREHSHQTFEAARNRQLSVASASSIPRHVSHSPSRSNYRHRSTEVGFRSPGDPDDMVEPMILDDAEAEIQPSRISRAAEQQYQPRQASPATSRRHF